MKLKNQFLEFFLIAMDTEKEPVLLSHCGISGWKHHQKQSISLMLYPCGTEAILLFALEAPRNLILVAIQD